MPCVLDIQIRFHSDESVMNQARATRSSATAGRYFGLIIWLGFAFVFYRSGLAVTTWLLEPEHFAGGIDWVWVALFPVLVPGFFVVNRRYGCASGACRAASCESPPPRGSSAGPLMP